MKKLSGKLTMAIRKYRQRKAENRRLRLIEEANRRIQVRDFDNMLCLSIDGLPILPLGMFDKQLLNDARLVLYNYLNSRR